MGGHGARTGRHRAGLVPATASEHPEERPPLAKRVYGPAYRLIARGVGGHRPCFILSVKSGELFEKCAESSMVSKLGQRFYRKSEARSRSRLGHARQDEQRPDKRSIEDHYV